jgi:hypothetical protein
MNIHANKTVLVLMLDHRDVARLLQSANVPRRGKFLALCSAKPTSNENLIAVLPLSTGELTFAIPSNPADA